MLSRSKDFPGDPVAIVRAADPFPHCIFKGYYALTVCRLFAACRTIQGVSG